MSFADARLGNGSNWPERREICDCRDVDAERIVVAGLLRFASGVLRADAARVPALLSQVENQLASFSADGAYDKEPVYEAVQAHSPDRRTRLIIPPHKRALLSPETATAMQERNRHIRAIDRLGRRQWHLRSGYTKRSKVENCFHRYKALLGRAMKARTLAAQRVEARIGCRILNTMASLGMPESYRVA